jgi:hypothetical protein
MPLLVPLLSAFWRHHLGFGRTVILDKRCTECVSDSGIKWMSRSHGATMRPSPTLEPRIIQAMSPRSCPNHSANRGFLRAAQRPSAVSASNNHLI